MDEATKRLSKRVLTSASFMAFIATVPKRNAGTAMEVKKYGTAKVPKGPGNNILTVDDDSELLLSRYHSMTVGILCKRSSKCSSKRRHRIRRSKDVELHS